MASGSSNGLGPYGLELVELFDVLVNVIFCVKDPECRYVEVNQAFVRRTGRKSKREVVGRTARDFFPPARAERYEEQDDAVFRTRKPLRNELELIPRERGGLGWYLSTKLPLVAEDGGLFGLASVSRDLATPSDEGIAVESLTHVVHLVERRLAERLRVADLAEAAGCSNAQLERRMHRVFGLSATQYVLRTRVDHAAGALIETDRPIADIAVESGFYDQSNFTRIFARMTGETPAEFRATHA